MRTTPIKFEKVLTSTVVDKAIWEAHLDQVAKWVLEECKALARSDTI